MTSPRVPQLRKQLVAVVDGSTTMVCLDCAGQVRDVNEPFTTLAGEFERPPFHRWCRTVVRPALPGMVEAQRTAANAEISERPLKERRKGPDGVGARIPPPPHAATFDRRRQALDSGDYDEIYDRLVDGSEDAHKSVISRYLAEPGLDQRLRTGDLTADDLDLVAELDTVIGSSRLTEQVTVFTALGPEIARGLRVSDIVSSDSYLETSLSPDVAAGYGPPVALTLPAGLPALRIDRDTQRLLLARRHSWRLLALGLILVAILL